ncbi:MAG TPA: DUF2480 family protein [Bacteroidia bacterium]|nr:DUF2480 family protein [Bacteroidia bacterium]HQK96463.1 DUF2480 family protein [Bacteroidia bacterium]
MINKTKEKVEDNVIFNKVAQSGLITINLEELYPVGERVIIDIREQLIEDFLLREKSFREFIASEDWSKYSGKFVSIHCSNDAIIPMWAWMLLASALEPFAKKIVFGNASTLEDELFSEVVSKINPEEYHDARVVIKGCSDKPVPVSAYVALTALLRPVAKSILFGEPCSTVPVYKKK